MKRDMDLIREILLSVESDEEVKQPQTAEEREKLDYHWRQAIKAGLVTASTYQTLSDGMSVANAELTPAGHDFVESVRDPAIWKKTKDGASAAGGFTVELLGEIAKGLLKTKIKQHTGIDV